MAEQGLQQQLAAQLKQLDARSISPPIEIAVGDYAFYPYRGFADIAKREDFRKLSSKQLKRLSRIADDILAMQRPELFEAFVNDDGIIVVDNAQAQVEYSIDIHYNDARSRVEEIYPQVTYPQSGKSQHVQDMFIRNDTAHEVAHHADFWMDMRKKKAQLEYLHSSSVLLAWIEELDILLHPQGVASLIQQVRDAEGYVAETLLEEGYSPRKVDQMLRAEFFAIAGEFYYGSKQHFAERSALLEAYMEEVLDMDLKIQRLYIPFKDMEMRRGILREAIHSPVKTLLGKRAEAFFERREHFLTQEEGKPKQEVAAEIETLVIEAIKDMAQQVQKKIRLPL